MSLSERDKKHLWHPLTQHKLHPDQIAITRAEGCLLYDDKDKSYIDGIASWYTCMYGHSHPYIVNKVQQQMQQLDHVVFAGFTHEPAIRLSEALMDVLPDNQDKMFFSDDGSTAVDVAIKMALQYHFNRGQRRSRIIALEKGFHGDTFGAMSVSGLSVYNSPFKDFFIDVERIPVPTKENIESVKKQCLTLTSSENVAALIYEPLVQGAAAMKMYDGQLLDEILDIMQQQDVLTIADEVMTGFGKTGKHFASDHHRHDPDIICMGKSLTGGIMPMAITSCTKDVYNAFLSDDLTKGFFHGHTYTANPIGCSAALACIELLQSGEIQKNIALISEAHQEFDRQIKSHPRVLQTRQLGIIYALDLNIKMERYGDLRNQLFSFFLEKGVYLRPLGNTIYILAPYVISQIQLKHIYKTIEQALDNLQIISK
jgi:adenosylmethionine-8-amino-7-oxononanoate aminotransferase